MVAASAAPVTLDRMISNGLSEPVTYQPEGELVSVTAKSDGPCVVFTVPDTQHMSINTGKMMIRLIRVN